MKIAIPLNSHLEFYHSNPFTAPKFAIYTIETKHSRVVSSLHTMVNNPWKSINDQEYKVCQVACQCTQEDASNVQHITEHYFLLECLGGCDYLLANHYCDNMTRALKNGGITIYKIPPFIHRPNYAIKNFLLGASFANTIKNIHHAS